MSLSRVFWNEFRPLFRMLEDPLGGQMAPFGLRQRGRPFDHPFSREGGIRPSVDLSEEGNAYIVEAELPGVKKENIEVNVGDNGQSVTIQGRIHQRSTQPGEEIKATQSDSQAASSEGITENRVASSDQPLPLSSERYFSGDASFTRTVWLPREVDQSKVTAKLEDGILTLRLPKASDSKVNFKVNVE